MRTQRGAEVPTNYLSDSYCKSRDMLKSQVHPLSLAITFWMMSGGKVESDVKGLIKGAEEMRNKLQTFVRDNVGGNSVVREYMEEEKLCEL